MGWKGAGQHRMVSTPRCYAALVENVLLEGDDLQPPHEEYERNKRNGDGTINVCPCAQRESCNKRGIEE
jgi:hypothetical protein